MRLFSSFALTALATVANGAAVPRTEPAPVYDYDAIVVGGGPAGLSALSGLARVRVTPAYFRWAARQQLSHYPTVTMTNGTVTKITPGDDQNTHFIVTTNGPRSAGEVTLTARKIVLATGLRDILPETPGVRENWGQGIFWCPWCDGHEHADQSLGLLGSLDNVPGAVREMVTLNSDVVALVNGTNTPAFRAATDAKFDKWETYLELHKVPVDNRTITAITRLQSGENHDADPSLPTVPEHDLFRVDFEEGESLLRAAFLAAFPSEQMSKTAGLITNIPGVYAIGDANSDNTTNVPHAMFSGKRTAVYLHVKLAREDGERELNGTVAKRSLDHAARSLWDTVNGAPGDILYAGEFDQ
ncbi:hypothetical protein CHGG_03868 [Chaetomium globosum CBS 148.51]|uniref:FAD/NAD(P)-binding domain-containing protein n=1 Tax=Chaetomium globosum (strain ATCC 6205 / CBS 148.51 / DSM 1962 / NBRC 6347 / NRRL 1970) TaxID=306901 RepID=Q2H2X8_CHAGB|nr:uncharacterized protein CHGG_03868 [Chaetomium globosum CBS 148.51]EAQ87249.1 hypothetical protein CHGG_03868 [Chaetomium globosum CBS 148.51]